MKFISVVFRLIQQLFHTSCRPICACVRVNGIETKQQKTRERQSPNETSAEALTQQCLASG